LSIYNKYYNIPHHVRIVFGVYRAETPSEGPEKEEINKILYFIILDDFIPYIGVPHAFKEGL